MSLRSKSLILLLLFTIVSALIVGVLNDVIRLRNQLLASIVFVAFFGIMAAYLSFRSIMASRNKLDREIAHRKRIEIDLRTNKDELTRSNRALRAISAVNRAILRADDEKDYLAEICAIIVKDCGYAMAWIGAAEHDDAKSVRPLAQAGSDTGYLDSISITWADEERGRDPTGTAIRTARPSICGDMLTDPVFEPWREEAAKRGYAASIVIPLITASHETIGALTIYSKVTDPFLENEVRLLSELADDVTYGLVTIRVRAAHAAAKKALQQSRERLDLALLSSRMAMFDWDVVNDKRIWSDSVHRLLGTDPATFTGSAEEFFRVMHPDDRTAVSDALIAAIEKTKLYESEYRAVWPDGSIHHIASRGTVYDDASGKAVTLTGVCWDITERKQAQDGLRESEERFRAIASNTPDHIMVQDRDLRYTYVVNPQLGLPEAEMIGKTDADFLSKADAEKLTVIKNEVLTSGRPFHIEEIPLASAEGETHFFRGAYVPKYDTGGQINGLIGYFTNITPRKRIEEALQRSHDELEQRVAEELFKAQNALVESKRLSDIGTLAATVAHELRNPLAAIKMASYNIKRKNQNAALENHLKNIDIKVNESEQIIGNLLFYSKIKLTRLENVNIHNILNACITEAQELFSKKHAVIDKDTAAIKDMLAQADPLQIKEVFTNILNNAFDAIPQENGRLMIRASSDHAGLEIAIGDNGEGIGAEDIKRVFEPFFTTKAKGTGLGLALCQQIVHLHDGSIRMESEKGSWTKVSISFPFRHG